MIRSIVLALTAMFGVLFGSALFAEQGSAAASGEWSSYVEGLAPLGARMTGQLTDPNDPLLRQEMYKYMYSEIAQGYFELVYQDSEYPDFWPIFNQAFNFGFPNPDDSYYLTPVKGNGVYRISGFRGTVRMVDFQIGSGEFFYTGRGVFGPTLKNYDLDHDAHVRKDGSFDVILSAERPGNYKGDWWRLDPKATYLFVRQISYDWIHEVDGRFAIERLDIPAIKPRDSAEKISAQLKQIASFTENWTNVSLQWTRNLRARGTINKVEFEDLTALGGHTTQRYYKGAFDLAPDEALILETEVPKQCRYWMVELMDELAATLDWTNRQVHLNGYTARLDADGKFRAVISSQDPGVPNWLDAADYTRGIVLGRWKDCSSFPLPTTRKVKLADVRQYLPASTPVVSAEARDAAIRLRRKGAQLRRRW